MKRPARLMNWLNQYQLGLAAVAAFGLSLLIARAVVACIYP